MNVRVLLYDHFVFTQHQCYITMSIRKIWCKMSDQKKETDAGWLVHKMSDLKDLLQTLKRHLWSYNTLEMIHVIRIIVLIILVILRRSLWLCPLVMIVVSVETSVVMINRRPSQSLIQWISMLRKLIACVWSNMNWALTAFLSSRTRFACRGGNSCRWMFQTCVAAADRTNLC